MNPLEASYRRLLRAYPVEWREERGEELLAVLMEWAPDHQTRPGVRDALDLIWNGLRTRITSASRAVPQTVMTRMSLLSLAGGAAMSAFCLRYGEVPPPYTPTPHMLITIAPFYSLGTVLYVAWLATVGLLATGVVRNARRATKVLVALTGFVGLTSVASRWNIIAAPPLVLMGFMGLLALSALGAPKVMTGSSRAVLGGLAAIFTGSFFPLYAAFWGAPESGGFYFYRSSSLWIVERCGGFIALALAIGGALASLRRPGWLVAAVLAGVPWLGLALTYWWGPSPDLILPGVLVAAAGGLALLVRDGMRAVRRSRVTLR